MLEFDSIISFIFGSVFAFLISYMFFSKKSFLMHKKIIELNAQILSQDTWRDVIKQDIAKITNETIISEQEDLRRQNRESLEEKIRPLTQKINEFQEKVERFNISGVENTTKIIEQINILEKNNKLIEQEAKNLTEALTNNQNIKGAYGENLLQTILSYAGMEEGIHYSRQYVTTSENLTDKKEHVIRPDIVINLPNNQNLIIDSKMTLSSYIEYTKDEKLIKEFKLEIKKRIMDLSNKNYQSAKGLCQPDFVLMYIPIEPCVSLLYQDLDVINYAYKSNIIIVGTASLLTTLRLVAQLFSAKQQNDNVKQIIEAGTNLYDTFTQFCDDLIDLQKRFNGINSQFTKTLNRFRRNNPNKPSLFSQVEELKSYGITSNKEIPENLYKEIDEKEGTLING